MVIILLYSSYNVGARALMLEKTLLLHKEDRFIFLAHKAAISIKMIS